MADGRTRRRHDSWGGEQKALAGIGRYSHAKINPRRFGTRNVRRHAARAGANSVRAKCGMNTRLDRETAASQTLELDSTWARMRSRLRTKRSVLVVFNSVNHPVGMVGIVG